jgi:hypothetical protein
MLSSGHSRPTVIQIFPQSKVWQDAEKSLTQMNKDGDLQNGIRVQMGQIQKGEIKETAEKGGNRKSKTTEKKRNVHNGLVGVLCWNSNPTANSPRTELLRRKNSDRHEMEKIRLRNNRHMVTCESNWLLGSMGGITATDELDAFHLGAIYILLASGTEAVSHGRKESLDAGKQELGHRKQRHATTQYIWGFPGPDIVSKKHPVNTRRLFFENEGLPCHHSAAIPKKVGVPCHPAAVISKTAGADHPNSAVTSKAPTSQ